MTRTTLNSPHDPDRRTRRIMSRNRIENAIVKESFGMIGEARSQLEDAIRDDPENQLVIDEIRAFDARHPQSPDCQP